jgi:hypothetical protein
MRFLAAGVNTTFANSSRSAANPAARDPPKPASTARRAAATAG